MRKMLTVTQFCFSVLAAVTLIAEEVGPVGGYESTYRELCAVCHGENLEGATQGKPLAGVDLVNGDSVIAISNSISKGAPGKGMPEWSKTLTESQIKALALYITETRSGLNYANFNYDTPFTAPVGDIKGEKHVFRLETIVADLDPLPFSIAPLPDGRILLTEKKLGLSIISREGKQSPLIEGTPKTYSDTFILTVKQEWGSGWMLDVAIHPEYEKNGWVYIYFGDRCSDCNEMSRAAQRPVSMNKLVRGRIKDGKWEDEEVIWQADIKHYGVVPDIGAGGRISFDDRQHVFMSVGIKGFDNHTGIQDLKFPWGKIHRIFDDGRIPDDNPFTGVDGALKSIWTYGHRSPQGLEYNFQTGDLWGTEMGPRGGDEVNRLLPGRNYGWPLYSKGQNYDGTPVDYGKKLGIEFELKDIEQAVVDLTPSPAVSSFIFYTGQDFPNWRHNLLVGSLKARSLYRMELNDNKVTHRETLFRDLARVRDIEAGPNGEVYVLLEHNSGGQIVRLVPGESLGVSD
ncbi:MAG TPA: PQQ-dependent sugar dehydrogenase [Pseudomonadales bacterium]|jgi:glucose/arabinose dehydrogenase|nr:glucose sorbosone dehydrogenase [Gammaproteobacteria bacterium]MDP6026139.1 PQQ-dependent sugar dehydrogenase [Pseudomonadales bacterium]MDP6316111.1 PQQ-dependent sugar dehydrogenase [Pseudomonadales bacterium]MDP7315581.1 PQQ-dependent sugar dehydrogenase [Pseudomonadales bacterium]HJL60877.1 PQQ-dependent sugar dehydrogenase [Pseudomonadales bacterium]|tara:strand:- start:43718 stop:45259 length:1542 start_codon:yes stop_codon:yes gene_type:complete